MQKSRTIDHATKRQSNKIKSNIDDIVDQRVLGNALQRISELERIGQHQLNADPPRAEAANQTNATNAVEELYQPLNVSLVFGDKVRLSYWLHQQAHHVDPFRLQEEHRVAQHLQRHLQAL